MQNCSFFSNIVKISGANRSAKITDPLKYISVNVIYFITCTLWKKIYIGETGRRLADHFREHLRDCKKNDTNASKPVARHFRLSSHSHHNMAIRGLSLHHGNTESLKILENATSGTIETSTKYGMKIFQSESKQNNVHCNIRFHRTK